MKYAVNEIFHSIQGQGYWSGTPAVFVRLQGCDVGCPWCNEKATWEPGQATRSVAEIVYTVGAFNCPHVILTGGEPLAQDISPLIEALSLNGWRVQIETSGVYPLPDQCGAWITLAPKFRMNRPMIVEGGMSEIKVMVGKPQDIDDARPLIAANPRVHVFLHPISGSAKATAICVDEAMRSNWRVSVQLHEVLGLR